MKESNCRNCGAPRDGSGICPYCGTRREPGGKPAGAQHKVTKSRICLYADSILLEAYEEDEEEET